MDKQISLSGIIIILLIFISQIGSFVLPPSRGEVRELWNPPEGSTVNSRDEWLRTHGLGDEGFTRMREKVQMIGSKQSDAGLLPQEANFTHVSHSQESLDGCIRLSEHQADLILEDADYASHNSTGSRVKRKLYDFRSNPARKWTMPIKIMFDGQHSDYEMQIIRAAFQHWEDGTCVRFQEVPTNERVEGQYVLITRQPEGCFTFVGKTEVIPQQFNLEYNCLWEFGIPVHEIGHILGLWHEHQREDRDSFIKINWDNLGYYESQFYKINTLRLGQTYDYSSVMHYSSKEGSKNGKVTIEATDRRFQSNMGQRIAASFIDKKMINLEYCKSRCYGPEPPCRRDGYQDPNNCYSCICPDGFSGPLCQYVDTYKGFEPCGGVVNVDPFREITIESPGYSSRGYYMEGQACNWLIRAPAGYRPVMRFQGEFGVYCHLHEQCYHWVEVRTDENLGANGGRYCCYKTPNQVFRANTDEMLVIFRSNYSSRWTPASRGFRIVLSSERVYNPADTIPVLNPAGNIDALNANANNIPNANNNSPPSNTQNNYPTGFNTRNNPSPPPTNPQPSQPNTAPPNQHPDSNSVPAPPTQRPSDGNSGQIPTSAAPGCEMIDLALVLDASGSMSSEDYRSVKSFCSSLIERYEISSEKVRLGVITFANSAKIEAYLNRFYRVIDLQYVVTVSDWRNEWTNTSGALATLRTNFFAPQNGDRTNTRNIALLVQGGKSNLWSEITILEAERARRANIDMYVVGVSSKVNMNELEGIAGDPSRVLHVPDYNALKSPDTIMRTKAMMCNDAATGRSKEYKWECSFEPTSNEQRDFAQLWCGIEQVVTYDDFNWTLWSQKTPSDDTGPDKAKDGFYYIYIEASNVNENEQAIILVPKPKQKGQFCLSFYYHMRGYYTGTLQVFVDRANRQRDYPKTENGHQSDDWLFSQINIYLDADDQIGFRAVRGRGYSSDIALDDLKLVAGYC